MGCSVSTLTTSAAPPAAGNHASEPTADEPQIVVAAEQPSAETLDLTTVTVVQPAAPTTGIQAPAPAPAAAAPAAASTADPPVVEIHASYLKSDFDPGVEKWGRSVFEQFDTDKDGGLSAKELTRALKSLPRTKPKTIPPGAKFMSVDEMIAAMDADGDGSIDLTEWLERLASCAGLAAALAENVNEDGEIPTFRSFEQQQAKRKREVDVLEAKESRTEEEEAQRVEYRRQIESLQDTRR